MPLSCPVAPPSQREMHKDGGGGGGGVAMRARAVRAPKAKGLSANARRETLYDSMAGQTRGPVFSIGQTGLKLPHRPILMPKIPKIPEFSVEIPKIPK